MQNVLRPRWQIPMTVTATLIAILSAQTLAQDAAPPDAKPVPNPLAKKPKNPLAKKKVDPFVGVFKDAELTVTITGEAAAFTGAIVQGENTMTLAAKREGEAMKGAFTFNKFNFPFTATLAGATLTLQTEDTTYTLTRVGTAAAAATARPTPANPAGAASTPAPAKPIDLSKVLGVAPKTGTGPALTRWETMSHPSGLAVRYPFGWRVVRMPTGAALMPDDGERDIRGAPLELMLVQRGASAVAASAGQTEVTQYADDYMHANYPGLKRVGQSRRMDTLLGPGTVLTYEGRLTTNVDALAMFYTTLHEGHRVFLAHVARQDLVPKRQALAERVFRSMGHDLGETPAGLVGSWVGELKGVSGNASKGLSVRFEFGEKGDATRTVGPKDAPAVEPDLAAAKRKGTWRVIRGKLFVAWDDGAADLFAYQASGKNLTLTLDGQTSIGLTREAVR